MKKYLKVLAVALLVMFCSVSQALTWDQMTRVQKNSALLSYATSFPNGSYGGQCIIWMKKVVNTVSWKVLPTYQPYPYEYKLQPSTSIVQRYVQPGGFQPGDIVQMKLLSNGLPHTAMVVDVFQGAPGYIIWIDSNWFGYSGYPEKVFQHTMSIPDFNTKVGTQYSVYNIK